MAHDNASSPIILATLYLPQHDRQEDRNERLEERSLLRREKGNKREACSLGCQRIKVFTHSKVPQADEGNGSSSLGGRLISVSVAKARAKTVWPRRPQQPYPLGYGDAEQRGTRWLQPGDAQNGLFGPPLGSPTVAYKQSCSYFLGGASSSFLFFCGGIGRSSGGWAKTLLSKI